MIKPMLAKNFKDFQHRINYPVGVQPKLNGLRMISEHGKVYSRTGKPLQLPPELRHQLKSIRKFNKLDLDGELYAHGVPLGRICGNAKRLVSIEQDVALKYHIFDIVEDTPSSRRNAKLISLPTTDQIIIISMSTAHNEKDVMDFLDIYIERGYEGIMVRDLTATYQQKRTGVLLKLKPWHYIKVKITGHKMGTGKYKHMLGAFIVVGKVEGKRFMCRVGSGFTDAQRQEYWTDMSSLIGKTITIKYIELTEYNIPYSPIFVKLG